MRTNIVILSTYFWIHELLLYCKHNSVCYDREHSNFMLLYHYYTDTLKYMAWLFHVSLILIWYCCYMDSHVCILWLFMYSCYIGYCYLDNLVLLYMNISWIQYMIVSCIPTIDMTFILLGYTGNCLRHVKLSVTWNKVPHHIRVGATYWTHGGQF